MEGYNCSQSVFAANAEKLGMDFETALKVSEPLGGGVGRLREVCGALTSCAMLLGLKYADAYADPEKKKEIYERVQNLAAEFKKANGSIICRELLNLQEGAPTPPAPAARTAHYYKTRPCAKIVETADKLVKKHLA